MRSDDRGRGRGRERSLIPCSTPIHPTASNKHLEQGEANGPRAAADIQKAEAALLVDFFPPRFWYGLEHPLHQLLRLGAGDEDGGRHLCLFCWHVRTNS